MKNSAIMLVLVIVIEDSHEYPETIFAGVQHVEPLRCDKQV